MPPAAAHFTAAKRSLAKLRAMIATNIDAFAACEHDERTLASLDFNSSITLLKVEASELALETVMHAMRACGLSGYRNDGDFSDRPAPARRAVGTDHDQQRPDPGQYRDGEPDEHCAGEPARLNHP